MSRTTIAQTLDEIRSQALMIQQSNNFMVAWVRRFVSDICVEVVVTDSEIIYTFNDMREYVSTNSYNSAVYMLSHAVNY